MKSLVLSLLVLGAFLVAFVQKEKTIVFYGDSITAGYGLSPEQAYPALVEKALEGQYTIINAGLSGETSAGGLSRLDWVLNRPTDIFVLALGANDALRGLPLGQTEKNLQAVILKVKQKYPNVKIALAGMKAPPNLGEQYTKEFENLYVNLAQKNDVVLIPFLLEGVAGHKELNQPDGIHPNPKGHSIIADLVIKNLRDIL